jgi:hypothetical protein
LNNGNKISVSKGSGQLKMVNEKLFDKQGRCHRHDLVVKAMGNKQSIISKRSIAVFPKAFGISQRKKK